MKYFIPTFVALTVALACASCYRVIENDDNDVNDGSTVQVASPSEDSCLAISDMIGNYNVTIDSALGADDFDLLRTADSMIYKSSILGNIIELRVYIGNGLNSGAETMMISGNSLSIGSRYSGFDVNNMRWFVLSSVEARYIIGISHLTPCNDINCRYGEYIIIHIGEGSDVRVYKFRSTYAEIEAVHDSDGDGSIELYVNDIDIDREDNDRSNNYMYHKLLLVEINPEHSYEYENVKSISISYDCFNSDGYIDTRHFNIR